MSDWRQSEGGTYVPTTDRVAWLNGGSQVPLPGKAEVDVSRSYKYTVQVSPRYEGAVYVPQGRTPVEFSIVFTCWLPEHEEAWVDLMPKLMPPAKVVGASDTIKQFVPIAIRLQNRTLANHGVTACFIEDISGPKYEEGGVFKVTLKGKEFLPPKKVPKGLTIKPSEGDQRSGYTPPSSTPPAPPP